QKLRSAYNDSRDIAERLSVLVLAIEAARNSAYANALSSAWSTNIVVAHVVGKVAAIEAAGPEYKSSTKYTQAEAKGRVVAYQNHSRLLRCIFGNPFRPMTLKPKWLTRTVKALAGQIYNDRAFDRMPVLADALEEAGCTVAEVLEHCRNGGEHVRGCW